MRCLLSVALLAHACNSLIGIEEPRTERGSTADSGTSPDAGDVIDAGDTADAADATDAAEDASEPPSAGPACRILEVADGALLGVRGRVHSIHSSNAPPLWTFDALVLAGPQELSPALTELAPEAGLDDCLSSSVSSAAWKPRAAFSKAGLADGVRLLPLAGLVRTQELWTYYGAYTPAAGLTAIGYGIARFDATSGEFVAVGKYLWESGEANFGTSVIVDQNIAYLYGCRQLDTYNATCSVARVDLESLSSSAAYEYFTSDGTWTHDPAAPRASWEGGIDVSVVNRNGQYLMFYARPLGDTVFFSSAPSPVGPWSKPIPIIRCEIPESGSFCQAVSAHPYLEPTKGIAITYALGTFVPGRAEAAPREYWTRLVRVTVP